MSKDDAYGLREGEIAVDLPAQQDAGIYFIGRIETPWKNRAECPKNPSQSDAVCTIHLDPRYAAGLKDLETCSHVIVLYFMNEARRDIVLQRPRHYDSGRGVFALRSPARPNPIAMSAVRLEGVDGTALKVRGLDCVNGTPLVDIKPYFASIDAHPDAIVGWREASECSSGLGEPRRSPGS